MQINILILQTTVVANALCLTSFVFQDVGFQHGKLVFTGWARGDIIKNMLKDHRSADYNDSKIPDVRGHTHTNYLFIMIYNYIDIHHQSHHTSAYNINNSLSLSLAHVQELTSRTLQRLCPG